MVAGLSLHEMILYYQPSLRRSTSKLTTCQTISRQISAGRTLEWSCRKRLVENMHFASGV